MRVADKLSVPDDDGKVVNKKVGQRGKVAEKLATAYLEERHQTAPSKFDWYRLPDARMAGGRFPAQIADFELFFNDGHGILEVKEIDHEFRLPQKNFAQKKHERIKRRLRVNGIGILAVYHTPTSLWRFPNIQVVMSEGDAPSWDLSVYKTFETFGEGFEHEIKRLE
jgi:hypothetical protein